MAGAVVVNAGHLMRQSLSDSTKRSYRDALDNLSGWVGDAELSDQSLADYIAWMAASGKRPATAALTLAAVRKRARLTNQASPAGPITDAVMAGFRRESAGATQAPGLTWDMVEQCVKGCTDGLTGDRDAAILSLMSDAMMRVGELVSLNADDIGEETVCIRRSKTDQESVGAELYLGPPTIATVRKWMIGARITEGPLFRPVYQDQVLERRLSKRRVMHIVKTRAAEAGFEASGHSLRVGSCQSLAAAGASLVEMQQVGRWADPKMPAYYARKQLAGKAAMAKYRYGSVSA